MFLGDGFLRKRNVGFEEVNGVRVLCRAPPFILPIFDQAIPTCTGAVSPQVAESSSVPPPGLSSVASVAPAPPVTTSTPVVASTPAAEPTSVITTIIPSVTTVVTTATVIPESTTAPIIPPVTSESISSAVPPPVTSTIPPTTSTIPPVSSSSTTIPIPIIPLPVPLSITLESPQPTITSSTLGPISSTFIQTSPSEETAAPTSTITSNASSSPINPVDSSNEIVSSPTHLNTDAKVAIITAITLSILFLFIGFLYFLHRRKRNTAHQDISRIDSNYIVDDDGEEARLVMTGAASDVKKRELGPNGYPLDIKMEDGTLLSADEVNQRNAGAARGRSPPLMQNPVYGYNRSKSVVSPDGGSTLGEMKSFERGPMIGDSSGNANGKKVDVVTLPMPATVAVSRAISDSGSYQSSETREDRINALSKARTLSTGTHSSLSNHGSTPPQGILKNKINATNSSPSSSSQTKRSTHRREGSKSRRSSSGKRRHHVREPSVSGVQGIKEEVPLSDASREFSQLTREYDVERKEKEKEKEGSHKKCMNRDRDVRVNSPTLPALDLKNVGGTW